MNENLKKTIKKIIAEILNETGPSAQGIIQPWLGPTLPDDTGIPPRDGDYQEDSEGRPQRH